MRTGSTRHALSAALGLAIALTVSGCAGGSTGSPEPRVEESAPVETAPATEAPAEETEAPVEEEPGQSEALDSYVALEREQIPQLMTMFDGLYSDIQIDPVQPGTVHFTYTFAEQLDAEAALSGLSELTGDLQKAGDEQVFPMMTEAGVSEPKLRYTYLNADGSEIWTHLVEPS